MKTTLNRLSFCQISLYSFVWVKSRNCGTLYVNDYFLFGLLATLCCLSAPFSLKHLCLLLCLPGYSNFFVLMGFLPNLLRKSIKHCSLSATAKEWQETFADENPAQLQTTFPLVVIDTVCETVPTKLATMKIMLDEDEVSDREIPGCGYIAEAVDFRIVAFLHNAVICDSVNLDFKPDCSGVTVNSVSLWGWSLWKTRQKPWISKNSKGGVYAKLADSTSKPSCRSPNL